MKSEQMSNDQNFPAASEHEWTQQQPLVTRFAKAGDYANK